MSNFEWSIVAILLGLISGEFVRYVYFNFIKEKDDVDKSDK